MKFPKSENKPNGGKSALLACKSMPNVVYLGHEEPCPERLQSIGSIFAGWVSSGSN